MIKVFDELLLNNAPISNDNANGKGVMSVAGSSEITDLTIRDSRHASNFDKCGVESVDHLFTNNDNNCVFLDVDKIETTPSKSQKNSVKCFFID